MYLVVSYLAVVLGRVMLALSLVLRCLIGERTDTSTESRYVV